MNFPEPEWLLTGTPREVQLEALRRSYYGYKLKEYPEDPNTTPIPIGDAPQKGWGHLLEMRLGKTPTMLNEFALFHRDHGFKKMIILSPQSYKEDWKQEAEKYGLPVPAHVYSQTKIKDAMKFVEENDEFLMIVNYEALQYKVSLNFLVPLCGEKTYIGSDESIKIKSHTKVIARGALELAKSCAVSRIASGLPITQGPQDFYAQARFIKHLNGVNYYGFRGSFCVMGGFKKKQVVGIKNEDKLQRFINNVGFVAELGVWGQKGGRFHNPLRLDMAKPQQEMYREMHEEFVTMTESGAEVAAEQVIGQMLKLQQISTGFVYDEDGNAHEVMPFEKTPKAKRLLEFLEEELVGKCVIPFHYSQTGEMLQELLSKWKPCKILGKAAMAKQGADVTEEKRIFNNDPNRNVMLVQIQAGKYGHDLTGTEAKRCYSMLFFENTFSLDDRTQVEARITTAFQSWASQYFDFFCSPVELKAVTALARKKDVSDVILGRQSL
tara:strand:+ start:12739 stop:14220 length:1482 start_codon:yes stop_codon:yes gene_type:complete